MSLDQIRDEYVSFPEIAAECGVPLNTAHNWANYHDFFKKEYVLGKPLVKREDFEQFKIAHPDLIKTPTAA